jgi:hypothetical protein
MVCDLRDGSVGTRGMIPPEYVGVHSTLWVGARAAVWTAKYTLKSDAGPAPSFPSSSLVLKN